MLDHENPHALFLVPVIDSVGEPLHQAATDIAPDDRLTLWGGLNPGYRRIELA